MEKYVKKKEEVKIKENKKYGDEIEVDKNQTKLFKFFEYKKSRKKLFFRFKNPNGKF